MEFKEREFLRKMLSWKCHEQNEFSWDHEQIWPPKEYGFVYFFTRCVRLFQAEFFKSFKADLKKEENQKRKER